MRITKVYIKEYKNLRNFHWELDENSPISVIIGKNASGKTNLLVALIKIFIDALKYTRKEKEVKSNFDFSLSYQKDNGDLFTLESENGNFSFFQNNDPKQATKESKDLPDKIFTYYAGEAKTFPNLLIDNRAFDLFAYLFPQDNHFLLLAMFASRLDSIKNDILQGQFGITQLNFFEITIQNPRVKNYNVKPSIENFFGASPELFSFYHTLQAVAIEQKHSNNFNNAKLTLKIDKEGLEKLSEFYYEFALYNLLQHSSNLGYIRKIDQFQFIKEGVNNPIGYDDLSEGERQRLGLLGAFAVYQGKETLFLLDEPDAFAHPRWQWDFVPDLENAIGHTASQQVIFTTHSPIVLSSLSNPAYKIQNGTISRMNSTFGNTVDETLAEQDVPYREGEVADKLKIYLALIQEGEAQSDEAMKIRAFLENKLGENHQELKGADDLIFLYE